MRRSSIVAVADGVRHALPRDDGAPVHTLDCAHAGTSNTVSSVPVRGQSSTKQ